MKAAIETTIKTTNTMLSNQVDFIVDGELVAFKNGKPLHHIATNNNCQAVNKMLQLQIDTLQWVLQEKQNRELESLKHVLDAKIDRLEYELKKVARIDIEETNNSIYQLEMLKCCRIVINKDFNS